MLAMLPRYMKWLPLALCPLAFGCEEMQGDVGNPDDQAAAAVENGLSSVNGLSSRNGLSSVNGLSSRNGLSSVNGLASGTGLMTTPLGRMQVTYIVRCALP